MASLYLHIPFCERKCVYCDFYSVEHLSSMDEFLVALHREIDCYASYGDGRTFETLFLGGGTPSLLTPSQLASILEHLREKYAVLPDAEITLETNPGTVDAGKLQAFRDLGVNRLSIGVQSFDDDDLKFLGRIHNAADANRCVAHAREAGFTNISVDLIFSLPGQTLDRWKANLDAALLLKPQHISAYSLIIEEGTPLHRMVSSGTVTPNPTDDEAELYEWTMKAMLSNGFEHYEVSNYALPGFRSRHNANYWNHSDYLGFGPSAHSFWHTPDGLRRWWNIAHISHYASSLKQNKLPLVTSEQLTSDQFRTERIFLGLRSDGLDMARFESDFGKGFSPEQGILIRELIDEDYLRMEGDARLRLTQKGYLLCDEICGKLVA